MKKFRKIYLEITNVCDLSCSFCPPVHGPAGFLTPAEFELRLDLLKDRGSHLYFHIRGEPLLHPQWDLFLELAGSRGFQVNLTTNGSRLQELGTSATFPALRQVNLSLQSRQTLDQAQTWWPVLNSYLQNGVRSWETNLRFWNFRGEKMPEASRYLWEKLSGLYPRLPGDPSAAQGQRFTLEKGVHISLAEEFQWPQDTLGVQSANEGPRAFCLGLRDQIGVLVDGTVVPCCLDAQGLINLGNINTESLESILEGPRAKALHQGFSQGRAQENLCRSCTYRHRFS